MANVASQLARAIDCNARGHLAEAEKLCRAVLRAQPRHPTAQHLLGVVLCRAGRLAEGETVLRRLRAQRPTDSEVARHLVDALHEQGKLTEAVEAAQALVALAPDDAEAYQRLGLSLQALGRLDEAVEAHAQALVRRDDLPRGYFNLGTALQALSRLDEAVAALLRAAAQDPGDADSCLCLGNALGDLGRHAEALEAYEHALKRRPGWVEARSNAGLALQGLGRLDEALECQRRVVAVAPGYGPGWTNLGGVLQRLGRLDEAVAAFERAAVLQPDDALVLSNLAQAVDEGGGAGLTTHRRAVAADPHSAVAHYNLGLALVAAGQGAEARDAFARAAELAPAMAEPWLGLGNLMQSAGHHAEAVAAYGEALVRRPDWPEALSNAGLAAAALDRLDEAEVLCRRAVDCRPDYVEGWTNLGGVLSRLARDDQALAAFQTAARLAPQMAATLPNLALGLDLAGDDDSLALTLHRQAVASQPDNPVAHFNLGVALLRRGQYGPGWQEYEWRWRGGVPGLRPRGFPQPRWDGGDLDGRTLLLHAEQGLGDTLQFVRFARMAAARGGRVVLEVQPPLARLLDGVAGVERVVAAGQPLPDFDCHLPLMSLPGVLAVAEDAFADGGPYVTARPEDRARWQERLGQERLGADGSPMVGVVWSGNPKHRADRQRSMPAAPLLEALAARPVRLVNLQKDIRAADRAAVAALGARLVDPTAELADFADTAAVVAQLDLVVTVDTAVAHLAGAMGRPVWLLLPRTAEWRWLRGRDDTPWYPTMRLFRQERAGDWAELAARVAAAV